MSGVDQEIRRNSEIFGKDVEIAHKMVHGTEEESVQTDNGLMPSYNKRASDALRPVVGSINEHAELVIAAKNEAAQSAKEAKAQVANVNTAGGEQIKAIDAAGQQATTDVQAEASKQVQAVTTAGTTAPRMAVVPRPDFHLPLINDLTIREGKGTPYQIDVSPTQDGSVMVDLPMYRADFRRGSKSFYIDKNTHELTEADINQPCIEQKGLRIYESSATAAADNAYISYKIKGDFTIVTTFQSDIGADNCIWSAGDPEANKYGGSHLYINSSGLIELKLGSVHVSTYPLYVTGTEHTVAVVKKGNMASVFVDGSKLMELESDINILDGFKLGNRWKSSAYLNGHIKEFKIWNYALSPEQVANI